MEKKKVQFDHLKTLNDEMRNLSEAFNNITSNLPWTEIDQLDNLTKWHYVIPFPDIEPSDFELTLRNCMPHLASSDQSLRSRDENVWKDKAISWLGNATEEIRRKKRRVRKIIKDNLPHLNALHKTTLTTDEIYDKWLNTIKHLTWGEFHSMVMSERTVGPYIAQILNEWKKNHTLASQSHKAPLYLTFEDLFILPANVDICVDVLRKYRLDAPLLGEKNNWIGSFKDRGVIVAWIDQLEAKGKIRRIDRKQLVGLLNNFFSDLNMGKDARVFNNITKRDVKDYFASQLPQ
ncbi:hypothetical protein GCM10027341_27300 [Spirosoma knui]